MSIKTKREENCGGMEVHASSKYQTFEIVFVIHSYDVKLLKIKCVSIFLPAFLLYENFFLVC